MPIDARRPRYEARRLSELVRAVKLSSELARHDAWHRDRIEDRHRHLLATTIEHARARSPLYRELYRELPGSRELAVTDLPVVTKGQLMDRFDDWVTDRSLRLEDLRRHIASFTGPDGYYEHRYRILTTGGSSGTKAVFAFPSREWTVFQAQLLRFMSVIGIGLRLGKRVRSASVAAGHPFHVTYRGAVSVDVGAARVLRLEATEPMPDLVARLNAFQPEWLHAYPSIAALLADEQRAGGLRIAPRVVSTSSELRTPEMAERIEAAWGSAPFDMYGMTEVGVFGMECERHRLHAMDDHFIFEVVDATNVPVAAGETGSKLLVTNLLARTQPLIRYEVDDMIAVSAEPCPCGRPYPVLRTVEGRSDDVLRLPDGRGGVVALHPMHFRSPLAADPGVRQYQVVRRADDITISIVPADGSDEGTVRERLTTVLEDELRAAGVEPPVLRVEFVRALDRDPSRMSKLKLIRDESSDHARVAPGALEADRGERGG